MVKFIVTSTTQFNWQTNKCHLTFKSIQIHDEEVVKGSLNLVDIPPSLNMPLTGNTKNINKIFTYEVIAVTDYTVYLYTNKIANNIINKTLTHYYVGKDVYCHLL